jgi:hypothetical protein
MGSIPIVGSIDSWRSGLTSRYDLSGPDLELAMAQANDLGGYPSGQRGLTVNQLADAFGGSNPSPPTGPAANGYGSHIC